MGTAEPATRPRLYLIDGSGYVYRAFHALPSLGTSRGLPTNAVYGFTNMVVKLLREERPRHLAVVFDLPGETFRDQLYADYKATRAPMPDELRPQMGYVRKVVEALRLPVDEVLAHLDAVEQSGVRGAKKLRETLAREAETARLSKELATIRCDLPVALDLERLRWEGPDAEKLRPLFAELEFTSLLRDLVPSGAAPEVAHTTPRTPEEMRAALGALAAAGAVAVVPVGPALEGLALAGPSGPAVVIAEPGAPGALAAPAPLLGDLAVAKPGPGLTALRLALARRGVALAGPGFDLAPASYC